MKIVPVASLQKLALAALCLSATTSIASAGAKNRSTTSGQEKADAVLAAAMKDMETGVWSVNGTVTFKKAIKLHGLLSGEDFDLTMEPGVKPGVPMRGILIKEKAWVCSDRETWHAGSRSVQNSPRFVLN